jgi:DGQHR domain-containing protein
MVIRDANNVAKVIDGQHRIKGLESFSGPAFHLNVTIFIDMDIEDQAMVFATINIAQTKVTKSLVYDLYEFTKRPSPQKTSHNIAKLLNSKEGSPFEGRIKILGRATRKYQTLTQAAVVEALISLISGSIVRAEEDRELLKRNKQPQRATETEEKTLVFRDMFIDDKGAEIARVLWNYFASVRDRWPQAWNGVDVVGNMLPRTNGFRGLMRFLPYAYHVAGGPPTIPPKSRFLEIFRTLDLTDGDFNTTQYEPGTGGETRLFRDLLRLSSLG